VSSGLAVDYEDVFAGRPAELETRARNLQLTADAISRAAEALLDLVDGQTARSIDAVRGSAEDASAGLRRAHGRYDGTATALTTFAVELETIQAAARTAVDDADAETDRSYRLESEIGDLRNELVQAEAVGESTTALDDRMLSAADDLADAQGAVDAARRVLNDARQQIYEAADRAIGAIETAIEDGADSFGDNWDQFWSPVGDFFEMVGEWASQVLSVVVDALMEALSALVSALVVIALLLVAAVVIGLVVASFGLVGLVLLGGLLAAALLLAVVAETVGRPQQTSGGWTSGKPTDDADVDADNDLLEARDYQGIMAQLAEQDSASADGTSTEIRVVAVRNAAGEIVSWRVQLPSTQCWNPLNSDGSLNDLRADVMLSMFPGVPTQYEEAVWDAMTEAGVFESDAPIMFTGWSLGGMMAGDLATDPRVADRVDSVFAAGSAIDKHYSAMPPDVRVTQINNGIDPVHTLEFVGLELVDYVRLDNNWQTYRPLVWPIHDSTMYGAEAERYLPEPRPGDEIFFADPDEGSYEDVYSASYTRGF
jgi:hypothetical protein